MKQDPRCFRRQPGDSCALIGEYWNQEERGICAFHSEGVACVRGQDFLPCDGGEPVGTSCLDNSREGVCTDVPGFSQLICLH